MKQAATDRVAHAKVDAPLHEVAATIAHDENGTVVICDDEHRPVGIVTQRDLVGFLGRVLRGDAIMVGNIGDLMTSPVITVTGADRVSSVTALLHDHRIRSLPVVDVNGRLTGLLRSADVLQSTVEALEQQRDRLEFEVAKRTAELQEAHDALVVLSRQDPLTGLGNRRAMEQALVDAERRASRYGTPYAVILADIDHFKAYNDNHGHQAGDEALRRVAGVFRRELRTIDLPFRYGGEEILGLLPETDVAGALVVGERLRAAIEAEQLAHPTSPIGHVTVSVGVAAWGDIPRDDSWEIVVAAADGALYEAKDHGRNRAVAARANVPATLD